MSELESDFHYDVFLSHSSKDKSVVREIAERLKGAGLRVSFDAREIKPGDSIPAKIERGLEKSRVLVFCMSADAFGLDWAQLETGTFRFRDPLIHNFGSSATSAVSPASVFASCASLGRCHCADDSNEFLLSSLV